MLQRTCCLIMWPISRLVHMQVLEAFAKIKKRTILDVVISRLPGGNKKKKLIIKSYIRNY